MAKITLSDVGDHFFVGLQPTTQLNAHDRALLTELRPAGVILFKSNFLHGCPYDEWLAVHAQLIDDIRAAVNRDRLIIAIDHEGGRVCRTPAPITRFGYAAEWAGQADAVGHAMGTELASLGINLSFAPVLDTNSNPSNPVIGARAFGTSSEAVSAAALKFMAAIEKAGVLACGKHFPGHGDTDTDSHYALPILRQNLAALRERELKPFVAAIAAGIPLIMTAHMYLPAIDPVEPVTLSQRFNQALLRDELGFTGVVTSDDIGMRAVSALFDDTSAAVRLLASGTDVVMVCSHFTDTDRCRGLATAMIEARRSGALPDRVFEMSQARIHALLERTQSHAVTALSADIFAAHARAGTLFKAATVEVT